MVRWRWWSLWCRGRKKEVVVVRRRWCCGGGEEGEREPCKRRYEKAGLLHVAVCNEYLKCDGSIEPGPPESVSQRATQPEKGGDEHEATEAACLVGKHTRGRGCAERQRELSRCVRAIG